MDKKNRVASLMNNKSKSHTDEKNKRINYNKARASRNTNAVAKYVAWIPSCNDHCTVNFLESLMTDQMQWCSPWWKTSSSSL
ncbi:hypothetical protein C1H46_007413 [Malus baccata]|uniref:Uncharacterized protein n=1 Tax=Malus baccata TaxID=106549 RepID=A0A540N8Y0_MALBA|nr:hypothetical protein C1H46_007413 [Malus baccata]